MKKKIKQYRLNQQNKNKLVKMWETGNFNCKQLEPYFNISSVAIRGLLKRRGFKIPPYGRFKKGIIPWSKGTKGIMKGWSKGMTKETDERIKRCSERMKKNNPMKGDDVKEKSKISHTGYIMPESQKKRISKANKGKKRSEATIKRMSESKTGEKNPMTKRPRELHWSWKGGITPLVQQIRHCFKYRKWIDDVFTRDDYTCQKCKARSGNGKAIYLEAHHIDKFSDIFIRNKIKTLKGALKCKEFWNINNGQTLCKECHKEFTFKS